jgi:hypothetical protein
MARREARCSRSMSAGSGGLPDSPRPGRPGGIQGMRRSTRHPPLWGKGKKRKNGPTPAPETKSGAITILADSCLTFEDLQPSDVRDV